MSHKPLASLYEIIDGLPSEEHMQMRSNFARLQSYYDMFNPEETYCEIEAYEERKAKRKAAGAAVLAAFRDNGWSVGGQTDGCWVSLTKPHDHRKWDTD